MDYDTIIARNLRRVTKEIITLISEADYQKEDFQLFITFETQHPGVDMPEYLQKEYPDEMTVLLQHEFENLQVSDKKFSLSLSFDSGMEDLTIPFSAIVHLQDPTANLDLELVPLNIYDLSKESNHFTASTVKDPIKKTSSSDVIDLTQYQD